MFFRTYLLRVFLFLPLAVLMAGIMACSSNPSAPQGTGGGTKTDTTHRILKIMPDTSTATVRTRVIFTLSAAPALPKPYSVSWLIDAASSPAMLLRTNTDTLSYTFTSLGKHTLRAVYIDSTGSRRDSATSVITIIDTVTPPPPFTGYGAFNLIINNETFDRAKVPDFCSASAGMYHSLLNGNPGDRLILSLDYSRDHYSSYGDIDLTFWVTLKGLSPQACAVTDIADAYNAHAGLRKDSRNFLSLPGGSFTITAFDTVQNIFSGSFLVVFKDENDPTALDTMRGAFSNVCFDLGLYGQGSFTSNAGGVPFRANNNDRGYFSAKYVPGTGVLTLDATELDGPGQGLTIAIYAQNAGRFPFAGSPMVGQAFVSYSAGFDSYSIMNGGSGSVTITKYDPVARRVSGNFSFTAMSNDRSKTITVTNGVIDNVMWARE